MDDISQPDETQGFSDAAKPENGRRKRKPDWRTQRDTVAEEKQLAKLPAIRVHLHGPIEQYLALTKQSRETFMGALEQRDPNAVTLFAAEVVFGELQRLNELLERQEISSQPTSLV